MEANPRGKGIGLIIVSVIGIALIYSLFSDGDNSKTNNQQWGEGDYGQEQIVNLDVNAVQKAFQTAKSPQDFETEVNKLYTGSEIVSIYVKNQDKNSQNVTLYIDEENDGFTSDDRKLLTLTRKLNNDRVEYTRQGYGPYGYYNTTSPLVHMAQGALIYWALTRPFYATPIARHSDINRSKEAYKNTPEGKKQAKNTKNLSKQFKKNAPDKYKQSAKTWAAKSKKKGSWYSGSKKANKSSSSAKQKSRKRGFFSSSPRKSRSWGRGFRRR